MKKTKKEIYGEIIVALQNGTVGTKEQIDFLSEQVGIIAEKSKELSPTQKANIEIKKALLVLIADGKLRTATQVKELFEKSGTAYSVQKIVALLKQLVESGEVIRVAEGKAVSFKIATVTEDEDISDDEIDDDEIEDEDIEEDEDDGDIEDDINSEM